MTKRDREDKVGEEYHKELNDEESGTFEEEIEEFFSLHRYENEGATPVRVILPQQVVIQELLERMD